MSVSKEADALRDQVGKTVAAIRTMNDTVEYEFGVDREPHIHLSQTILRAGLPLSRLFWNQTGFSARQGGARSSQRTATSEYAPHARGDAWTRWPAPSNRRMPSLRSNLPHWSTLSLLRIRDTTNMRRMPWRGFVSFRLMSSRSVW